MTKEEIELAMEAGQFGPCPVRTTLKVIDGRWKMLVFRNVMEGVNRFGALRKALPWITQKMLTTRLRELEADGMIERTVYPVVPPKVEYALTPYGQTLFPILRQMWIWGEEHIERQNEGTIKDLVEVNGDVSNAIAAKRPNGVSRERTAVLNGDVKHSGKRQPASVHHLKMSQHDR